MHFSQTPQLPPVTGPSQQTRSLLATSGVLQMNPSRSVRVSPPPSVWIPKPPPDRKVLVIGFEPQVALREGLERTAAYFAEKLGL